MVIGPKVVGTPPLSLYYTTFITVGQRQLRV
jgi:hypothetical protein